ncbi:MAG: hypothetical protein ACK4WD_05705 [Flavobacteriales bacterium]|jgi:hypothetical protein
MNNKNKFPPPDRGGCARELWRLEFGSWSLEFGGIGAQIAIMRSLEIRIQYSHLTSLFILFLIVIVILKKNNEQGGKEQGI